MRKPEQGTGAWIGERAEQTRPAVATHGRRDMSIQTQRGRRERQWRRKPCGQTPRHTGGGQPRKRTMSERGRGTAAYAGSEDAGTPLGLHGVKQPRHQNRAGKTWRNLNFAAVKSGDSRPKVSHNLTVLARRWPALAHLLRHDLAELATRKAKDGQALARPKYASLKDERGQLGQVMREPCFLEGILGKRDKDMADRRSCTPARPGLSEGSRSVELPDEALTQSIRPSRTHVAFDLTYHRERWPNRFGSG